MPIDNYSLVQWLPSRIHGDGLPQDMNSSPHVKFDTRRTRHQEDQGHVYTACRSLSVGKFIWLHDTVTKDSGNKFISHSHLMKGHGVDIADRRTCDGTCRRCQSTKTGLTGGLWKEALVSSLRHQSRVSIMGPTAFIRQGESPITLPLAEPLQSRRLFTAAFQTSSASIPFSNSFPDFPEWADHD